MFSSKKIDNVLEFYVDKCQSHLGQLKLSIYGNERRISVTIHGMRGLVDEAQRKSYALVRISLCPDTAERERFKSAINEIKAEKATFNETFTFHIPENDCSRRLLISTWQRLEHRMNSRFMGCMSFSVRKLKSQHKTVHGWYQLLGEILGRRKHLSANEPSENYTGPSQFNQIEKNTQLQDYLESVVLPLSTIQINPKFPDMKLVTSSKQNLSHTSDNSLKLSRSKITNAGKENRISYPKSNIARTPRRINQHRPSKKQKMYRRGARNVPQTPSNLIRPTLIKPLKTKSALIISRRHHQLRKSLAKDIRVLYTDDVTLGSSHAFGSIQVFQPKLSESKYYAQQAKVTAVTNKLLENSSDYAEYLDGGNKENSMPAIPTTNMYVEPDIAFDTEMFSNGLTLTRTGRVRAKKQHLRMAAYLQTQKMAAEQDKKSKLAAKQSNYKAKDKGKSSWRKLSSTVDDDRGYFSEPENDYNIVEVYRVDSKFEEMAPNFSTLHSAGNNFKRLDYLDNLESIKSHIELLTLNDASRGPNAVEVQPKKRLRPSFLIALRRPFVEAFNKRHNTDMEEKFYEDELNNTPLMQNNNSEPNILFQKNSFLSKTINFLGSTTSLCSEKTYKVRRSRAILHKLKKLQRNVSSNSSGDKKGLLSDESFRSPRKRLERSNSNNEELRKCYLSGVDIHMPSMTLNRLPKSKAKENAGVYVQLTRNNPEDKTPEIYSLRKKSSENVTAGGQNNAARRSNALGTLMTWLQKRSPDSRDSSPYQRSASISGRPKASRRTRSFSRGPDMDCKKETTDSDETYTILRRNSFTASRRTSKKRSFRQSKRLLNDENTKPTEITLEEMMKNKVAMQAFRNFLKSEYSEENIDFWLDCEYYKSIKTKSKQTKMAFKIFSQYLARSAPREVNIDFETRARTEERLKNPDKNTFVEPQSCIYSLMKCDSYRRFVASENYLKLHPSLSKENNRIGGLKMNFKNGPKKNKSPR